MKNFTCKFAQDEVTKSKAAGRFKQACPERFEGSIHTCPQAAQREGRSHFYARSVCVIREHGKMARTPLAAFFNRPTLANDKEDSEKLIYLQNPDQQFEYFQLYSGLERKDSGAGFERCAGVIGRMFKR